MFPIVRSLIDRFKTLFVSQAVLELEADLIAAFAERKAELLQRADQYEKDGLASLAQEVRLQAESLSLQKPLESAAFTIASLQAHTAESPNGSALLPSPPSQPGGKKKKHAL